MEWNTGTSGTSGTSGTYIWNISFSRIFQKIRFGIWLLSFRFARFILAFRAVHNNVICDCIRDKHGRRHEVSFHKIRS